MKKKKILFLIGALNGGGAERILVNVINNLPQDKFDITFLLFKNEGIYLKEIKKNIKVKFILKKPNKFKEKLFYRLLRYTNLFGTYRFWVRGHYDIEISFLEGLTTHIIGCSPKRTRKIAWVHTDMYTNRWADVDYKSEKQHKNIYKKFDDIVCVSKFCAEQFKKRFGIEENVSVITNPFDCQEIMEKSNEEIQHLVKRRFTFVTSGRLTMQKGFDRLLRVHKKLINDGIVHDLWIIGDGVMKNELQCYVNDNNLNDSVKLLGFHSNPYPYMLKADCFVCSSRSEGYSSVVAEAFILGLPVISVKCSGASELLEEGKSGILVENNEEALYQAMKEMVLNKATFDFYKKASVKHSKDFNLNDKIEEITNFLEKC